MSGGTWIFAFKVPVSPSHQGQRVESYILLPLHQHFRRCHSYPSQNSMSVQRLAFVV